MTWKMITVATAATLMWSAVQATPQPPSTGLLELTPAQIEGLRLQFAPAEGVQKYVLATLPAVIAPPPNARIAVAATYPGTVLQTLAVEGDAVRRGQPLAVIASREILTLGAELAQARARLAVAEANADRQTLLAKEGIVADAKAEEARAAHTEARAEADEKSRMAEAVKADGAKGTYTLTAPIDGVVAASRIETGAPVDGMSAAFVVDAIDRLEARAQAPEHLIGRIAVGMRVLVDGKFEGRVTSVGRVVQPETRSAALKAELLNAKGLVSGGTATAAIYADAAQGAVRVPRAALAEIGGAATIFVRTSGGVEARQVEAAPPAGDHAVILKGLKAGEQVAVSNLSELKSLVLAK